jgi:hypothetical protein
MQITLEYMILIPVLILQLFLFPLTVGYIMNNWVDQRRTLELQETASHLGSTIQQVYFSLNHTTIQTGTLTSTLGIPPSLEGYSYTGNASWRLNQGSGGSSGQVLDVTLRFVGLSISTTTSVVLGQNVEWQNSTLKSYSSGSCLIAQKCPNGTIAISFGS